MSVCSKFSRLGLCQILFELVYSWESYHKTKKGELFIETQCTALPDQQGFNQPAGSNCSQIIFEAELFNMLNINQVLQDAGS